MILESPDGYHKSFILVIADPYFQALLNRLILSMNHLSDEEKTKRPLYHSLVSIHAQT